MPCAPKRLLHCATILALALLPLGSGLAGEVFQWKDADGRTHYSDVPPPDTDTKRITTVAPPARPSTGSGSTTKSWAEREVEFRERRTERLEEERKQAEAGEKRDKLARQCADAKRQLAALESGQRVVRFNDQGERVFLDDAERAREVKELRESIAEHCTS